LVGNTVFFDRTDQLSAYTVDLSSLSGGTGGAIVPLGFWNLSNFTFPPAAPGEFRFNNATLTASTLLYKSKFNNNGTDVSDILDEFQIANFYYMQQNNSNNKIIVQTTGATEFATFIRYDISNIITEGSINYGAPFTFLGTNGSFGNTDFYSTGATWDSATDKLQIDRNDGGNFDVTINEFNSLSANTIYSGSTDLYDIFLTTTDGNDITRVQPGTNITTGGTANEPIVNLVDSPFINNLSASGTSNFTGVIQSGGTDLYSIFLTEADGNDITRVQPGSNITTGGTGNNPVVSVFESPSFNQLTTSGLTNINSGLTVTDTVTVNTLTGISENIVTATPSGILENSGIEISSIITSGGLLDIYQSGTTNTATNTNYVDVEWDSSELVGSLYSYTGATISILEDAYYEINYSLSLDVATGGRKNSRGRLVLDEGGGFNEIPRSAGYSYHRNTTNGEDTITKTIKRFFNNGDTIKLQFNVHSGGGNLSTINGDSNITITKLTNS